MDLNEISTFITHFETVTQKPEKYLSVQTDDADRIKSFTRDLYAFTKRKEFPLKQTEALNELVITNLDEEQIWQQVELQNNSILDTLVNNVSNLLAKKNKLKFPFKEDIVLKNKNGQVDVGMSRYQDVCDSNDYPTIPESKKVPKKLSKKTFKSSIVDDKFFKLHEMEEFLEKMEKTGDSLHDNSDSDEDNEPNINYFTDDSISDNETLDQAKYRDFFDDPNEEFTNHCSKQNSMQDGTKQKKKVKFLLQEEQNSKVDGNNDDDDHDHDYHDIEDSGHDHDIDKDGDDDDDNDCNYESDSYSNKNNFNPQNDKEYSGNKEVINEFQSEPSTFEARQERLKKRIAALEQTALKEKPWQMKGEISADNRPQNSLLQEYVEFDVATRPAPVFTEKTTLRLEDIILQRIKDKAFDDVVRKIKPLDSDLEYKKKLVLDQEKSKLSLAEIYEQEYLKQIEQKATADIIDKPDIEPPEHQEIKVLMKNLFAKLDSLSNFHFTPKPASAEVKIISNLPAITMEEVAPIATSDATLLAPEEVKGKQKGELIGKSERTTTDKKRERRKKKLRQKLKFKSVEKKAKEALENAKSNTMQSKQFTNRLLQKITKSSNVTALQNQGKYIKSSSAFFSKLQDECSGKIQRNNLELRKSRINKKSKKLKK